LSERASKSTTCRESYQKSKTNNRYQSKGGGQAEVVWGDSKEIAEEKAKETLKKMKYKR